MKQFAISVFLFLFHYCLAPHYGCPKDRPFLINTNTCGSFSDICINYKSEQCEFGIRACEQCPLSNFSYAILHGVLRKLYGGEAKNCSQIRNETKPVPKCPDIVQKPLANRDLQSILIIVSWLFIVSIVILVFFIFQYIRDCKRRKNERAYIEFLSSDSANKTLKKTKKKDEKTENQKYFIIKKLEEIAKIQKELIETKLDNIAKNQKEHIDTKLDDIAKNQKEDIGTKLDDIAMELLTLQIEMYISWEDAENGFVPSGAIEVGNSCIVARAEHEGQYTPGKLIPNDKCAYISYGNKEIPKSRYQVLVDTSILKKSVFKWIHASCDKMPPGAIIGGTDKKRALYIAKHVIEGEEVVGKFLPEHRGAYFPFKDEEVQKAEPIQILCYSKMKK